jgi:hypothetical protein
MHIFVSPLAIYPSYGGVLDVTVLTMLGGLYKSQSPNCSLVSSFLGLNILPATLFPNA